MSDYTDALTALVEDAVDDIIFDNVNYDRPVKTEIKTKELQEVETGTDDGCAYGVYRVVVNGGQFIIELTASGTYMGFTDCWDWGGDTHYTKDVYYDGLEDFHYEIKSFKEDSGWALDKAVELDVNSTKEK